MYLFFIVSRYTAEHLRKILVQKAGNGVSSARDAD
jgi:hypothetical protein